MEGKNYYVRFFAHGKKHETLKHSGFVLKEREAEGFAWGVLRCVLVEKGLPLTGYATNIEVIDEVTHECIWKCDAIEIAGSDEMLNAVQNKN